MLIFIISVFALNAKDGTAQKISFKLFAEQDFEDSFNYLKDLKIDEIRLSNLQFTYADNHEKTQMQKDVEFLANTISFLAAFFMTDDAKIEYWKHKHVYTEKALPYTWQEFSERYK